MVSKYFCLLFLALTGWANSRSYDYVVHIYTANKDFAGTDADVYIKFYDDNQHEILGERKLHPNSGDPYEKGKHDVAYVNAHTYLGSIASIEVKRGRTKFQVGDDWDLDKIIVEDPTNEYTYVFPCDCELGKAHKWRSISGHVGCKEGYYMSSGTCKDIDECKQGKQCSDKNAVCTNTDGGYHCQACKPGYRYDSNKCQDVDECAEKTHQCEHKCINNDGGYTCRCFDGFELEAPFKCKDVDECLRQPCDHLGTCINKVGTFLCKCPPGYETDNNKCKNINECLRPNACDYTATSKCVDNDGGYKCVCKQGYYNKKDNVCKDINECEGGHTCDPRRSVCKNVVGTYRCDCLTGFVPSVDGKSCTARTCNAVRVPKGATVSPSRCEQANSNSYKDVCTFSCRAGYRINDASLSQVTCGHDSSWIGTLPSCIPVSCTSLPPPVNGRVIPSQCSSGGTFMEMCSFVCADGYDIQGADKATCQSDGRWNASTPTCTKIQSEVWIRCPPGISVDLQPGESTADVSKLWQLPKTSSNAKFVTSSRDKNYRFPVGLNLVTWMVSNDNVHFKNCSFTVAVYDKEKPEAVNCPKQPQKHLKKSNNLLVDLPKVEFTDNVAIKAVEYSSKSPVALDIGTHTITVTATDTSDNIAYCVYQVIVRAEGCTELDAPLDGDLKCDVFNGAKLCYASCRQNKVIFNETGKYFSRAWYCQTLNVNPLWDPTARVPDCIDYVDYDGSSCPSGKVLVKTTLPPSPAVTVHVCGSCPSGTYYEKKVCKACPAGTYQNTTGNLGQASCKKCDPNTSSKPGSRRATECKALCRPGYYSKDGFHPCHLCQLGEYQTNSGAQSCEKCPSDRTCTRHNGSISEKDCGPCPLISSTVPSGNVQRLSGTLLELFCYVKETSASFNIQWKISPDIPGKPIRDRAYVKHIYNPQTNVKIGLKLSVPRIMVEDSGNYECVVENQFGEAKERVHVTVLKNQDGGSGAGGLSDEEWIN